MKINYLMTLFILIVVPTQGFAVTVGEIINPLDKYLNCEKGSSVEKKVCLIVRDKVNQILARSNISFNNGDILYKFNDGTNRKINTGHSCTYRTKITNIKTTTVLKSGGSVDLKGNSISKPTIFTLRLPIDLYTRSDIYTRLGIRFFGSCKRIGTDSFYGDANLMTTANLAILFSLEPKFSRAANGDYIVTIQPILDVAADVTDTAVQLEFHGVSPLASIYIGVVGATSSVFKGISHVLHGDKVKEAFQPALIDLGIGVILTNSVFPVPLLDTLVNNRLSSIAAEKLSGKASKFSDTLERRLTQKMSSALRLDSFGRRVFIIGKNFKLKPLPPLPNPPNLYLEQYCSNGISNGFSLARITWSTVFGKNISYQLQKGTTGTSYSGTGNSVIRTFNFGDVYRVRSCSNYGCGNYSPFKMARYSNSCSSRGVGPILQ